MSFETILDKILSAEVGETIRIGDADREIVFVASYTTEHYPDDEYLKVFFADGTLLEVMLGQKELYFCDDERRSIDRNLITDSGLEIDGKLYVLENGNDKQNVKKIYLGNIEDGEGECVFSDYSYPGEVWSLAVLPNGEISDVHARKIDPEDLK